MSASMAILKTAGTCELVFARKTSQSQIRPNTPFHPIRTAIGFETRLQSYAVEARGQR